MILANIQHVPRWTSVIKQAHIPMNIHQSQTNIRSLANFYEASNHKFKAMFHMFIHRQHDHNMYVVSLQNMPMGKKVGHAGFGTTA